MTGFLQRAVDSHLHWKNDLQTAIREGRAIDRATACVDDQCELGRWLHGEGQKFSGLPIFHEVLMKHAAFHRAVIKVAELVEAGRLAEAESELASGAYQRASAETIDCLHKLRVYSIVSA